jgi:3-keto-disaccharide hydrolase
MLSRRIFALCVLGGALLAACSGNPSDPGALSPADTVDLTIQHRDIDILDVSAAQNSQRFELRAQGEDPLIPTVGIAAKAPVSWTGITIEGRGSIAPPMVAGQEVQLTDVRIDAERDRPLAVALANTAGAARRGALQVFDIEDPFAPQLTAEILLPETEYASAMIEGDLVLALGNSIDGAVVDVFGVADRSNPILLTRHVFIDESVAHGALRQDDVLYVVTGANGGLHSFDATMLPRLAQTGFVAVDDARDIDAVGNTVLVLTGQGVSFVEGGAVSGSVSIDAMPATAPSRGALDDETYYVNTNSGLVAVDVGRREVELIFTDSGGTANGLSFDEEGLFFRANGQSGLEAVFRDRGNLRPLGVIDIANFGSANSAAAGDGFLLSGDGRGGVLLCSFRFDILDDFEGKLLQPFPWVEVYGDWILEQKDGSTTFTCPIEGNPKDRRAFWGTGAKWKNTQIDARMFLDGGKGAGIYFRATKVQSRDRQDAYVFQYDPGYGDGAFLFRKIRRGRESAPLAVTYKADVPELVGMAWYGEWRDIRIVADDDRLRAWVDGVFVVEAFDDSYDKGTIGVRQWSGTQAWFDDFRVTLLD